MSDRPKWRPSDEEIVSAYVRGKAGPAQQMLHEFRALIDRAVEKALAEQALALEAAEKAHDVVRDICARAGVHHPEVILRQRDEARKQLAEQEARHKREVIEARIDALDDLWVCVRRDIYGNAIECEWYNGVTPDSVRLKVARLASELAALDAGEGVKP